MDRVKNLDGLGFKFAIGDVLIHKGIAHLAYSTEKTFRLLRGMEAATRFVVTERFAQECPGGVQLKYACTYCRGDTGDVGTGMTFLEEELLPLPAPPVEANP